MRAGILILGTVIIALASYSAEARGGVGHGRGGAHSAGSRFAHHFGFNRGFNRFRNGGWGYGDYGWGYGGWGYGDYGYPYYAAPPNVIVMLPPPGAASARERVGDLPLCHEKTTSGVVIERGMGCSVARRKASAAPSEPARTEDPPLSQAEDPPSQGEDLPPCREVTPVGVVVERGTACLRGSG